MLPFRLRVAIGGLLPGKNYVVGLGARPSRAGSISRELLDSCLSTEFPPKKAGGFKPAPSAEMPALHGSKRNGLAPRPWERWALLLSFSSFRLLPTRH